MLISPDDLTREHQASLPGSKRRLFFREQIHECSIVHAYVVKTIANTLQASDRLALVSFDDKAKMHSDLRSMNDYGRSFLLGRLEKLQPEGRTNLWYASLRV